MDNRTQDPYSWNCSESGRDKRSQNRSGLFSTKSMALPKPQAFDASVQIINFQVFSEELSQRSSPKDRKSELMGQNA
jgi:hypothetical protein